MTPSPHHRLTAIATEGRLRAAAPARGHQTASDRRRILVCDADSQNLHALRVVLHRAGFDADMTRTAAQALDHGAISPPAAAITELMLPDSDGIQLCRRLREWTTIPVILLSAHDDEPQQVRAFDAGADDYITKPFRPHELIARLQANLRRAHPPREHEPIQLNGLEIDLAARVVRRDGHQIHLTPIEFNLLAVLTQNQGRLLTHNTLLQQVWGTAYTDARQTLRAHIANLRRKIQPTTGQQLIHTDHGIGYRLTDTHPAQARPQPPHVLHSRVA